MKVLYAEDELQLSVAVTEILKMENYEVEAVHDGEEAWEHLKSDYYDAAILDIMMPNMDGIQVLERMRQQNIYIPVLMLTAKNAAEDRVEGLTIGADDYLGKPFAMKELLARLNALIRRNGKYRSTVLKCGNISLDCETDELKSDQGSLRLSSKESELLALFMKQNDSIFTSQKINEILWNNEQDENAVKLYISYLRNKLNQIHADTTICNYKKGYIMEEVGRYEKA